MGCGVRAAALVIVGLAAVSTHTCAVLALAGGACFAARRGAPSSVGISVRPCAASVHALAVVGLAGTACVAGMRFATCFGAAVHRPSSRLAWLGMQCCLAMPLGHAPNIITGMYARFRDSLFSGAYNRASSSIMESPSGLRPPNRRSCHASRPSSASSIAAHALGPLGAACTLHRPDPSGLGAHAAI